MRVDMVVARTLRVQSTQIWGICVFNIRNRNNGFGNIFCIWVLGPLGEMCCTAHVSHGRLSKLCYVRPCRTPMAAPPNYPFRYPIYQLMDGSSWTSKFVVS